MSAFTTGIERTESGMDNILKDVVLIILPPGVRDLSWQL